MRMRERSGRSGAGYDYGNARLRAMKTALFGWPEYERLLGRDPEQLLTGLADTPYRPEVEEVLPRARGLVALQRALSANLCRVLPAVAGLYSGPARRAVDLLLGRWDLHNVLTIVRAQARRAPAEEVLPLLVPVGSLDAVTAGELARQPGLRPAVELMAAWGAPIPELARAAMDALPGYEQTGVPAVLEHQLTRAYARVLHRELQAEPAEAGTLASILREELDRRNLLIALRLREARLGGEPAPVGEDPFLPGGRLDTGSLSALAAIDAGREVEARLRRLNVARSWAEALDRWAERGDLPVLERDLEAAAVLRAVSLFWRGDPLGSDIPVAFVAAKENEVRNLRLLGHGATWGVEPEALREELVVPW
jgi:V/A-type H+-transporting ATPase subunit C